MLLHVVESTLPVHFHFHLSSLLKGFQEKMYGCGPPSLYPLDINSIYLRVKSKKREVNEEEEGGRSRTCSPSLCHQAVEGREEVTNMPNRIKHLPSSLAHLPPSLWEQHRVLQHHLVHLPASLVHGRAARHYATAVAAEVRISLALEGQSSRPTVPA